MIVGRIGKVLLVILIFAIALIPAVFLNTLYGYFPAFFLVLCLGLSAVCLRIAGL